MKIISNYTRKARNIMEVWNEIFEFMITLGWGAGICLVLGIIFIIIEMFTPGFAVPGITGIILLLFGIVLSADSFLQGLIIFLLIMAILSVILILVMRSATKGVLFKSPLILKNSETQDEGYISGTDMNFFVGREGKSLTMLRPAGTCDFDGVRLDVVTEGDFIDKDSEVVIIKVEGRRIVVSRKK